MTIVYVPDFDEYGNDIGYTESVPDMYVKEEPDCYTCNDRGCGDCDPSRVNLTKTYATVGVGTPGDGRWGGFSDEPPF